MRSPGNKERDSSRISLFLSRLYSPSRFHSFSLTFCIHMKVWRQASRDHVFFLPSLSVLHPTPVWETPGKHLEGPNLGHILVSWTMCMAQRVRGHDQPHSRSRVHLLEWAVCVQDAMRPPLESLGWSWRNQFPSGIGSFPPENRGWKQSRQKWQLPMTGINPSWNFSNA